jgi:octaprenyl-diphosphate synthase
VDAGQTGSIAVPLTGLYGPVAGDLAVVERIFDEELISEFPFVNSLCETVRSYRGKMMRPALLLLVGKATGGVTPGHHTLAAVVEMVHMATLVHDDVLDEADERRGNRPVHAVSGNIAAVLLGDYLISHAYHLCSGLDCQHAARRIGATTNTVCEGELLQNRHCGNTQVTESLYFDIIRRKTGALTATSCELGAYYAGADHTIVRSMRSYGMSAGVAFQIVDDILDIVGERKKVGKTLGRDLKSGKLTLPTIHALGHAEEATAAALRAVVAGEVAGDPARVRGWLDETGSLDYALGVAADYVADARRQLDLLEPGEARASLTAMAEFIIRRQF